MSTLVVLRIREPNLRRPFRVPGGLAGVLVYVARAVLRRRCSIPAENGERAEMASPAD